ncbi:MAG TPA: 4Fe-4S ferredoxin, partial [Desulfobacteraceae bacterium]|nr:4Fe-4S ferredoxin [Desulfobacteraceae bacterium]
FVDKYENGVQCVGCGRCVQFCPVNIDIREIFKIMNEF